MCPCAPGTDIAFLGGIINHVLANEKFFREYVVAYTNAAAILTEDYADTEDLDGVFSGLDTDSRSYDFHTWQYEGLEVQAASGERDKEYEAALLGIGVASYTAALISDTAVPAWHDGYREMPFIFVGSAATAAGGLGMLAAPGRESGPARNLALVGVVAELAAAKLMERRMGMVAEPYHSGKSGAYMKASQLLSALGAAGALARGRSRMASRLAGAALLAASAATRWGIFHAGLASSEDPKYTVVPQRERL